MSQHLLGLELHMVFLYLALVTISLNISKYEK